MIDRAALARLMDTLCPMYLLVDQNGNIQEVGPTLQKLRPDMPMVGRAFLDLFKLVRPRDVTTVPSLLATPGARLHLKFHDDPQTALRGLIAPLPNDAGAVINLSFGISILDAVRDYSLTSADFSGTDLAIELLYLVEAKSAAMEASRSLNLRLQGAMLAAEEQAYSDALTGLKNRRAMDHILGHLVSMKSTFALMHLDLDFFKSVNDRLGHAAGDFVLQQAARIMLEETRDDDSVFRIGGDEFILVFKGLQDRRKIETIANRLIERLCEPLQFQGHSCKISASIGIALSTQFDAPDPAGVVNAADLALYQAKRAGRAQHMFYGKLAGAR
ncbi:MULTISPECIES: GGDEF domain-containing protein [unclassified Ruegeria]|uniref:GGDEF domain-containing protein n=1 Tax=unclassified Ruegeria TaxID=2625375 RepID=UPI001487B183|nr:MULTISPECIES: GGDEF domain-containing protein [unclassified Ruegeria]